MQRFSRLILGFMLALSLAAAPALNSAASAAPSRSTTTASHAAPHSSVGRTVHSGPLKLGLQAGGGTIYPTVHWTPIVHCANTPGTWCWNQIFVQVTGPCDANSGCFVNSGGQWRQRSLPSGSNYKQYMCVASLGLGVAGALTTTGWIAYAITAGNAYVTVRTCIDAG